MGFWRRPQTHLFRRAVFQLHIWTGLVTGLYALFIGLTGALLMFRPELQAHAYPQFFAPRQPGTTVADAATVIANLQAAFPGYRFSGIDYPGDRRGTFLAYLSKGDELRTVFADPESGRVIGELPRTGWIQRLQDLHFNFLSGQQGYVVNGIAASCLLMMCLTGLVVWWPGVSRVRQAFIVHVRRGWKRVVWELHGAVGIWTVALLLVWSTSGIYFSFPGQFRDAVERVTTLSPYRSFESGPPSGMPPPAAADLIARARAKFPGAQVARFLVPSGDRGTYGVVLARERHGDGDSSDEVTIYFDRYSGREVAIDDQSGRTAGDGLLTWLGRLHVGNFGGWPVKLLWCVAALAFPLLFLTGLTMWWNRFVRPMPRAGVTIAAILMLTTMTHAQAPAPSLPANRVADYHQRLLTLVENDVVSLAEAMPADRYEFRPTSGEFTGVRTFGEQVKHLATMIYVTSAIVLEEKSPYAPGTNDNGPDDVRGKDAIVTYLESSIAYARRAMASLTERNALDPLNTYFGSQPRSEVAAGVIYHSYDHYGQMVVYARMNGVVPPASRR
jgi:uncharacterized iron-regulated membrane protein